MTTGSPNEPNEASGPVRIVWLHGPFAGRLVTVCGRRLDVYRVTGEPREAVEEFNI